MINDPLLAKAGSRYNPDKEIRDPWVAEHPYHRRGTGDFRGRGRGRGGAQNLGDIAQRRRTYTLGIPDPNRPRDLTGIPEFDKPKIEAAQRANESEAVRAVRERDEKETPDDRDVREVERTQRKKRRKKERLLQEQMHVASVMGKPLLFVQVSL